VREFPDGSVRQTTDGGATWTTLYSTPQKPLTYKPTSNGLLLGSDGQYYRPGPTYNASDSWERPNMVTGQPSLVNPSELASLGVGGSGGGGMTANQSAQLELERQKAQMDYDVAIRNGDRQAAQYAQTRLDTIQQHADSLGFNREELASRTADSAANRSANSAESAAQRTFQGSESAAQRAFTGGENALSRAQQAGEFAATYAIQKANQERQQLADRMQAAKTYSDLSGAADLTGFDRFMQAGGGVLGNAIASGATSLTDKGQLGAARALAASREPMSPLPDYNPYGAQQPGGVQTYNHLTGGLEDRNTPKTPQQLADAAKGAALAAAYNANPTQEVGSAIGNRYALGTMNRYAEGSFITGDSTDPMDPAAGGAHPEQITLDDPPGPDNARAEVTPLTEPGVGDTGGTPIGALLIAIGNFLDAQGAPAAPAGPPAMLGGMGGPPRYALGTEGLIRPEDQPYIDEVMATRKATQYNVNPYAYDFQYQSPTQRAIQAAAFQTATGAPGSEIAFEADKYKPGGLARNSTYASELQLGL
jgi:hypothetical protein